jgi:hypothetical protein
LLPSFIFRQSLNRIFPAGWPSRVRHVTCKHVGEIQILVLDGSE